MPTRTRRCLAELGVLGPELLGAHCTAATDTDLDMLSRHHVRIAHCPTASAALGRVASAGRMRGWPDNRRAWQRQCEPQPQFRHPRRGAASSTRLAVLGEPPTWISARQAVEMATIDGARAIGMGGELGSLTPGKLADIIVIDTSAAHWWPRHDWFETLVAQGKSTDVSTVVVDGEIVMHDRAISWLDHDGESRLHREAQRASTALLERAGLAAPVADSSSRFRNRS